MPIGIWISIWGHGWRSSRTELGSHLDYALRDLEHGSHHPAELLIEDSSKQLHPYAKFHHLYLHLPDLELLL